MPPTPLPAVATPRHLAHVRYEIRGPLARRAQEIERQGHEVIKLQHRQPGRVRLPHAGHHAARARREPRRRRRAIATRRASSRRAKPWSWRRRCRGIKGVTAEDVFIGNGVSELILMTMEALLEPGDEVLLPAPDYPLWTAAVVITGAKPVYYHCRPENGFVPDPEEIEKPRDAAVQGARRSSTPNNPTGAVYPAEVVKRLARIAEDEGSSSSATRSTTRSSTTAPKHVPMRDAAARTRCAPHSAASPRCTAPVDFAWAGCSSAGDKRHAAKYLRALELLRSLRLCANVPDNGRCRPRSAASRASRN